MGKAAVGGEGGRAVLASRDVALLWGTTVCDSAATWAVRIVVFVQILERHPPSALALVELAGVLPSLLLMPVAGTLADRYDTRVLSVVSMVGQAACLAALLPLLDSGPAAVAAVYAPLVLSATLWPPARQAWLYRLVEPDRRAAVNAAIGSVQGVMTVVGAAAGGVLTAWSPQGAVLLALLVQCGAVCGALAARSAGAAGGGDGGTEGHGGSEGHGGAGADDGTGAGTGVRSLLRDVRAGVGLVGRYPLARSIIWVGMAWGLIGGGFNVLIAGLALDVLDGGGTALGLFYAVDGTAVVLGSVLAARLGRARHLRWYALAYVAQGVFWALTFVSGRLLLGAVLFGVMRLASGVIIALDTTILLETVPERLRGRVTSLHMTTYNAVSQLSLALVGGALAVAGLRAVGVATGVLSALVGALWWATAARRAADAYRAAGR